MRQFCCTGFHPSFIRQTGAVFLAFMLALIVGSTWFLLSDLNAHVQTQLRGAGSRLALNRAKQALLFYAMNYPDLRDNQEKGPGFLPCPDQDNDGRAETNCAASTGTTLGRLPFTILGLDDPRDSSGERFWYAVSDNFRNTQSNDTVINSETPGRLSIDGTGDAVAVIIAPGEPVGGQHARPGNDAVDYLEDDNTSIGDGSFVTGGGDDFNDQVMAITRAELMEVVEQRVINEVRGALAQYNATHLAYPWLTPFADPRADNRILRGAHTGLNNAARLTDTRADFTEWGVAVNDIVRNVTDGSIAVVTAVVAKTLTVAGHSAGADNDFDRGDVYFIELRGLAYTLSGAAGAGSQGLVLKDAAQDFKELGIVPGDVIENVGDGSSGVIRSASRTTLTINGLAGGVENDFDFGEVYRIRSDTGVAASGSHGLTLMDAAADFIAMGIAAADIVENVTDGSVGRVDTVDSPTTLTATSLDFGRNNAFAATDVYRLPRYNGRSQTRKGLLSVHEPGKTFPGSFTVEWGSLITDGGVITGSVPGLLADAEIQQAVESSALNGAVTVGFENGHCVWTAEQLVECIGSGDPVAYLGGAVPSANLYRYKFNLRYNGNQVIRATGGLRQREVCLGYGAACAIGPAAVAMPYHDTGIDSMATTGTGGLTLHDSTLDFLRRDIVPGDTIFNTADGSAGMITTVDSHILTVVSLDGGAENDFDTGESYRVSKPLVNIEYLNDTVVEASFSLTVPPSGAQGHIRTSGIDYYLSETSGELPTWFIKNKWHQLLYVAYSSEFAPGGDGACTTASDCLVLRSILTTANDREALVVSSGMELAAQDRSSGALVDYYEDENATLHTDDIFANGAITPEFNDQAVAVSP